DLGFPEDVIDVKTRDHNPVPDPVQLVAYDNLLKEYIGFDLKKRHWTLTLTENGYKLKKCANTKDAWLRFRYMLKNYWDNIEYNKKISIWKGQK
ncbi:MAG: hypothetical protein WC900_10425, partial [Oscillospiraceae bacterium]